MARPPGRLILRLVALAAGASALAAAAPLDPVKSLAGRYSKHFKNGLIDGSTYWSDNIVEVVPVDATHAFVRFELQFYNGHLCALSGIAKAEGDALVYRDSFAKRGDGPSCELRIVRKGSKLTWNDADGGCQYYCGMRGTLANGEIAWSSKRAITYMSRLKASPEYREAIDAWQSEAK